MEDVRRFMESQGIPPRDIGDVPSSEGRFPDGAHYRIEIAGVERCSTLESLVDEARRRGVTVHRAIATVGGSIYLEKQELEAMAQLAAENGIELIMTPGPQAGMDLGRQFSTEEGIVSGMRVRGQENLAYVLKEITRCIDAGMRGFLITDEGLLWLLDRMRREGKLPSRTVLKLSVFAGHANAAGARVMQELGADSINPLADLTLPMLAAIRAVLRIPMDVYVILVRAMGGFNRFYEAAEIARVCAPCYFKFEPGESESEIYAPWNDEAYHDALIRQKVRYAGIVNELVAELAPTVKASPPHPDDLAVPDV